MAQQWEYCIVDETEVDSVVNFCSESSQKEHEMPHYLLIARLGKAGWEAVGLVSTSSVDTSILFKRPVESGRAIDDAF